jgi:uncharacterized Rossmann fold enzyme
MAGRGREPDTFTDLLDGQQAVFLEQPEDGCVVVIHGKNSSKLADSREILARVAPKTERTSRDFCIAYQRFLEEASLVEQPC